MCCYTGLLAQRESEDYIADYTWGARTISIRSHRFAIAAGSVRPRARAPHRVGAEAVARDAAEGGEDDGAEDARLDVERDKERHPPAPRTMIT